MNRGIVIASGLAIAAAATAFSMRACAATRTPAANSQPAAAAAATPAPVSQWEAGVNYDVLAYPQATKPAPGKVEVNEVFWYGCGHCYALDPVLEAWKKDKPAYIEFVRIPVIWGPVHEQHARLFYTLQKLGREDLHSKVFDAIHRGGKMLAAQDSAEGRAQQLAFFKENGVSEQEFNAAYDSPEVQANVRKARQLTESYGIASVPTMIVAGTYSTSVSQAGGSNQLLALINDLAAREQRR
ncbi:MAG TPA: thiol:disulfide interchange protein DsbA/DsbL [Steroidobacteraceae bacterium]|nr:thiol:disulfide interchange protein DsbA/DsbL [Steroidobacteraceae bacterium]